MTSPQQPLPVMVGVTLSPEQEQRIRDFSPAVELLTDHGVPARGVEAEHRLRARLADRPDVEVVLTGQLPSAVPPGCAVRWVQMSSAGVDRDQASPWWTDPSVRMTTAAGIHGIAISEWVFTMALALARRLPDATAFAATRVWPDRGQLTGRVLAGRTMGIIGAGSIGLECARLAQAFGMRVVVARRTHSRTPTERYRPGLSSARSIPFPRAEELEQVDLPELLATADVVVVTAPYTPATAGLIGTDELAAMRPDAHLVIASRGGIVDETALAHALRHGLIAGAATDVFEQEPLPRDSPLYEAPNLIMTPHISGRTGSNYDWLVELFCLNLARYQSGEPLINAVDKSAGY